MNFIAVALCVVAAIGLLAILALVLMLLAWLRGLSDVSLGDPTEIDEEQLHQEIAGLNLEH